MSNTLMWLVCGHEECEQCFDAARWVLSSKIPLCSSQMMWPYSYTGCGSGRAFVDSHPSLSPLTGKNGCMPEQSVDVAQFVMEQCKSLQFCGLMTIGRQNLDPRQHNPDYLVSWMLLTNTSGFDHFMIGGSHLGCKVGTHTECDWHLSQSYCVFW